MGITFAYELGLKSFVYEKSSTQKVTSEFNIFKILKNLIEKSYGAFKIWRQKKLKIFKLTSGAPFARCATSNRKKIVSKFFWGIFLKI